MGRLGDRLATSHPHLLDNSRAGATATPQSSQSVCWWRVKHAFSQVTLCMYSYVYVAETNQVSAEEAGWLMVFFWVLIAVSRTMIFLQQILGDR
jgi:hypothetical protein